MLARSVRQILYTIGRTIHHDSLVGWLCGFIVMSVSPKKEPRAERLGVRKQEGEGPLEPSPDQCQGADYVGEAELGQHVAVAQEPHGAIRNTVTVVSAKTKRKFSFAS